MSEANTGQTGRPRRYRCAICGRPTEYTGRLPALYPFCSPRCKWVDLGRWLRGEYSIDRDLTPEDLPRPDGPARPE